MTSSIFSPARALAGLGVVALLFGLAWWAIVFRPVLDGAYISYGSALVCLAAKTDLCMLAQAICRNSHFLGITRYSTTLFWTAVVLLTVSALRWTARALMHKTSEQASVRHRKNQARVK